MYMKPNRKYEQYNAIEITEQEKQALQKYISSRHIDINEILELNPDLIPTQQKKGWHIDLSSENIIASLDDIEAIYSAMYKYSIAHPADYLRVTRGTSIDEVKQIEKRGSASRFLSTALDSEEAMKFTEYQNGALITLTIGEDVPYIPMDDFLGETQFSESEVLLSPFTNITRLQEHYHGEGEVARYTASVSRTEFRELSEEERGALQQKLQSADISEYINKLSKLNDEIERAYALKSNPNMNLEDKNEIDKGLQKLLEEHSKLSDEFSKIKLAIHSLIEDRLRQVELNIDRQIESEETSRAEQNRQGEVQRLEQLKQLAQSRCKSTLLDLSTMQGNYFTNEAEQEELMMLAEKYGIELPKAEEYNYEMEQKFVTLKNNLESVLTKIEQVEIDPNATKDEIRQSGIDNVLNSAMDALEMMKTLTPEIRTVIDKEKQDTIQTIRDRISSTVTEQVQRKAKAKLNDKANEVRQRKIGILGKLTGKAKLQEQELKNIELKMQQVSSIKLNFPQDTRELEKYVEQMLLAVDGSQKDITSEEAKLLQDMCSTGLPIVSGKKIGTRKQTELLMVENAILQKQNQEQQVRSTSNMELPPPSELPGILDHAIFYTGDKKDMNAIEMQKTLGGI